MSYREKAILVVSGQILDSTFNPFPARSLHKAITRALKDRDVVLTRRVAALAPKHEEAAAVFLNAGFEIQPADNEDLQAAAIISSLLAENPLDEVVFMLGDPRPCQFLRSIAGKANRTLLTIEPLDDELALNLEGAMNIRELLSKEGVNCDVISVQNEEARRKASSGPATVKKESPSVETLCQTTPYNPEDFFKNHPDEWIAEIEKYLREHGGYALAVDVAQELDKTFPGMEQVYLKKGAIICNPLCCETLGCSSRTVRYKKTGSGAYFYLAEHKDLQTLLTAAQAAKAVERYEAAVASKDEWLPELEKFILGCGGKCRAVEATDFLEDNFPKIYARQLVWHNRDAFIKLLWKTDVRLLEEKGVPWFCHVSHPDLTPVEADNASIDLTIGAVARDKSNLKPSEFKQEPAKLTPPEIIAKLDQLIKAGALLHDLTSLFVERANLNQMGFDSSPSFDEREKTIVADAKAVGLRLWPLQYKSAPNPTKENYEKASKIYELLGGSLELLKQFAQGKEELDAPIDFAAIQLAVNLQCLLKSALLEFGVDPGEDPVQRSAYELTLQYRELYANGSWLKNLRWEDKLSLDRIESFESELERLNISAKEKLEKQREDQVTKRFRAEALEKLGELCDQLKTARENDFDPKEFAEVWDSVVELVTTLCRDYKEPFSSLELRKILYDVVGDIPEEIETSDEFIAVRQDVDLEKEREAERAKADSSSSLVTAEAETLAMRRVRNFYQGTKLVFVGGTPKKHIQDRLVDKLGFSEVIWDMHTHGDSLDRFNKQLRDPDVKIFLAYIPWCSHKHSRELAKETEQYGKALIRVSRGTNPMQIADSICEQTAVPELEPEDNPELLKDDE